MTAIRLAVAGLAVSLSLGAARASELEPADGLARPAAVEPPQDPAADAPSERTAAVVLPEQSVTTSPPAPKALPPLKPLPKWDPRVCIGC